MAPPQATPEIMKIDLHDPAFAELRTSAGRIATLLELQTVKSTAMSACLDDLLGAVYALIFARQQGFMNRPSISIELDKVITRAQDIAEGKVRVDGKWMAGFHFNSAIYRIAAVYHRVLRVVVGATREFVVPLRDEVKKQERYSGWNSNHLDIIHTQVNSLKHDAPGVSDGRTAVYRDAVSAVAELSDLIETWASAGGSAIRTSGSKQKPQ